MYHILKSIIIHFAPPVTPGAIWLGIPYYQQFVKFHRFFIIFFFFATIIPDEQS